jgi:hypothetical protein
MNGEQIGAVMRYAAIAEAELLGISEDIHTGEMLVVLHEPKREMWSLNLATATSEEFYERRFFTDERAAFDAFGTEHNGR